MNQRKLFVSINDGGYHCPHCLSALKAVEIYNMQNPENPIEIKYIEFDEEIYMKEKIIRIPILEFDGKKIYGAIDVAHYLGLLKGFDPKFIFGKNNVKRLAMFKGEGK